MPNAVSSGDTNNANNAPSSKKSKNKRKSLAVTTLEDVSPSRQEPLSPTTPAPDAGDGNLENVNKNSFIEIVSKRIRFLRKKLAKIEKFDEIIKSSPEGKNQLNQDQLQSYERRSELASTLKEFEEIAKQFDKENQRILKEQQEEREQAISSAVEEVKAAHLQSVISLIKFFRLVQLHKSGAARLTQVESESVETLQTLFLGIVEDPKDSQVSEQRTLETLEHMNKLCHGDENIISKSGDNGMTYSHIRSLIQSPPINADEEAEHETSKETRETTIPQEEEVTKHQDDNIGGVYTVPAGGLQFMLSRDEPSSQVSTLDSSVNQNFISQYTNANDDQVNPMTTEGNDIQEPYQQQQTFTETYAATQEYTTEQHQYAAEQQQQNFASEQTDKNQFPSDQQQEQSVHFQEQSKQVTDEQLDAQQQPKPVSQQNDQPPPLTRTPSYRGRGGGYRGNRGHRGQGQNPRRDSRDGNYRNGGYGGNFRANRGGGGGNANSGPRGNRGNGYQGARGGGQFKPRSQ